MVDYADLERINAERRRKGKREVTMSEARRLEAQNNSGYSFFDFLTMLNLSSSNSDSQSHSHSDSCSHSSSSSSYDSGGSSSDGGSCGGGGD
jgi:hypothetical protein